MDTPFGYLLAPNITPNPDWIGTWSADDFYRALHDGVNKRGQDMYPVMPYDFYTKVTRADSDAIFAYLRSVPPVRNVVDINHLRFPFDLRWSMVAWRELYFDAGTYRPDPTKSAAWNRGAYLVEGLGHCSACHSPRNAMGAIEKDKAFTGATVDSWFALNLTENMKTGLGDWTVDQIAAYLKTGAQKGKSTTLGPMAEVVHNSLQYLTAADLQAMAAYLKALPETRPCAPDTPRPIRTPGGETHRRQLHGMPPVEGARHPRGLPAARRQRRHRRTESERHHQGRAGWNSGPQRLYRDAGVRESSDRSAGRRHRELRAHELGQRDRAQCHGTDRQGSARHTR